MATKKKDGDIIRMQLGVTKSGDPELYEVLRVAGPYHRAKRVQRLASYGLSVINGHQVATNTPKAVSMDSASSLPSPVVASSTQPKNSEADTLVTNKNNKPHYLISDEADELLGAMLTNMSS